MAAKAAETPSESDNSLTSIGQGIFNNKNQGDPVKNNLSNKG